MSEPALRTDEHPPSEACAAWHCWEHEVDEADEPCHIACLECRHVFRTAGELLEADRRRAADMKTPPPVSVEEITCCPFCFHDW